MRTGQKVRVQDGTGPGSGGGRRGQTVHVRAPGGGGLFEHGASAVPDWLFHYTPHWDTDGYFTPDDSWATIPEGLGGYYLALASVGFWSYGGVSEGYARAFFVVEDTMYLGQTQVGWRAYNAFGAGAPDGNFPVFHMNIAWIGHIDAGQHIFVATGDEGYPPGWRGVESSFSLFRLGEVGEERFHGALVYPTDTSYSGNDNPPMAGATAFDTDGYATDLGIYNDGLGIPADLGGLYIAIAQITFTISNITPFLPGGSFTYGFDFAMVPVLSDNISGPWTYPPYGAVLDGSYNRWMSQSDVGGPDLMDIGVGNQISLTSFWIGRLDADSFWGAIPIPDTLGKHDALGQYWVHTVGPEYTYLALVRIAE